MAQLWAMANIIAFSADNKCFQLSSYSSQQWREIIAMEASLKLIGILFV